VGASRFALLCRRRGAVATTAAVESKAGCGEVHLVRHVDLNLRCRGGGWNGGEVCRGRRECLLRRLRDSRHGDVGGCADSHIFAGGVLHHVDRNWFSDGRHEAVLFVYICSFSVGQLCYEERLFRSITSLKTRGQRHTTIGRKQQQKLKQKGGNSPFSCADLSSCLLLMEASTSQSLGSEDNGVEG
jgi:hypothetical protein